MSKGRKKKRRDKRLSGAVEAVEPPSASDSSSEPTPSSASEEAAEPAEETHEDAFFARGDENSSYPPSSVDTADVEVDEATERRRRPEVIERRARMRRVVSWIVGAAAVLTTLVSVKALLTRSKPHVIDTAMSSTHQSVASIAMPDESAAPPSPSPAEALAASSPTPAPSPDPLAAAPSPTSDPAASPTACSSSSAASPPPEPIAQLTPPPATDSPTAAPTAPTEIAPAETAASAEPRAPAPSKSDVRRLIERGKIRDGVTAARATLEADPSDAETYLLLGAALQELGQWKESMVVFGQCVEQATVGPKSECRALRGH
jgi:hypothetical protein